MKTYILSMDAGTTSGRCILFDKNGKIVQTAQKPLTQHYPQPGWVEHDASEIWQVQYDCAKQVMADAGIGPEQIAGIGITNQRETTILWDAQTGEPVCPAIVWQCRRTAEFCEELKVQGYEKRIREKTGLLIDPYFSGTKIRWILDHVDGAREKAEAGMIRFGTVESWLIWCLSGGTVHVTDYSNASRTMLFDIHKLGWDEEILSILKIPKEILPKPVSSSEIYGYTAPKLFGAAIPICGAAGDQQAALFGQTCFEKGDTKCTYGTGGFLLMNSGEEPIASENGLLTTIAASRPGKVQYALEGSVFVAGAAIQWLRDELGLISSSPESEAMAREVPDTAGCYVVPAFTGLGAPYWNPYARGMITGLTRGVNKNHIIRATLESIALQINDVLRIMQEDSGLTLSELKVDGGACANDLLMQMQADFSNVQVLRPDCIETTALGAAYLAGLAVSFWKDTEEIRHNQANSWSFLAEMSQTNREEKLHGWEQAVNACLGWARNT